MESPAKGDLAWAMDRGTALDTGFGDVESLTDLGCVTTSGIIELAVDVIDEVRV